MMAPKELTINVNVVSTSNLSQLLKAVEIVVNKHDRNMLAGPKDSMAIDKLRIALNSLLKEMENDS